MSVVELRAEGEGCARRPASDAAHRLAWWIGEQFDADDAIHRLTARVGVSPAMIDRLLTGEVAPAEGLAERIAVVTIGAVLPGDWAREAGGGWLDAPTRREGGQ